MNKSINDILNTETNAIYVHLSRIKSVFTKMLSPKIAESYYIDGGKNKVKFIKFNQNSISPLKNINCLPIIIEEYNDEVDNSDINIFDF